MRKNYLILVFAFFCHSFFYGQSYTHSYSTGTEGMATDSPAFTMNNFSTCQTAVSLSANGYNWAGYTSVKYSVVVNGTIIASNLNGAYNVDLTSYIPVTSVRLVGCCASAWINLNASVDVTSPLASMPVLPTVSPVSYCQGAAPSPLTATLSGSGTTLKWYSSETGGLPSLTAPTPSTTSPSTTSYWVSQADASGCESPRTAVLVTIKPLANVNVTSQAVCNNFVMAPVIFSNSTTGTVCGEAGENDNVTLTAPAGAVFTSIPFASYGMPNGSCGSYTVGSCHAANSISTVSGLAIGQNSVTIPASNATFGDPCNGTTKRLYVEAVYNSAVFNWTNDTPSIGLVASGTGNIPSFAAVNTGSTPVVATITVTPTANGCAGIPVQFTITVNPTPVAPTAASQELCEGATVVDLVATGTVLSWYDVATNGTALDITTALATGTYYVSQTIGACESSRTVVSVTITPSTTNATTTSACDSYTWAVNGATYTASGTYASITGCHTETLDLTINSAPTPIGNATQTFSVATLTDATIEDLVVSSINVVWYGSLADAIAETNALPAGTQILDGAIYYAVNYENTCSSTPFAVTATVTLGTDNFDVVNFKYYPNPTSGMLTISYSKEISEVTVINLLGQTLFTKKTNALEVQMNLSSLPAATYLVKIVSEGQTKTIKVLKRE